MSDRRERGSSRDRGRVDDRKRDAPEDDGPPRRRRRREGRSSGWDQAPPPGVPVQTVAAALAHGSFGGAQVSQANNQREVHALRQQKRLYCGGLPPNCSQAEIMDFMNGAMQAAAGGQPGPPSCVDCTYHPDRQFAFLEFVSPEETTRAMQLDGIMMRGSSLKLRRPKDYEPPVGAQADPLATLRRTASAIGSGPVPISALIGTHGFGLLPPLKNGDALGTTVFVADFPKSWTEDDLRAKFTKCGAITSLTIVKDMNESRGFGYITFGDDDAAKAAIDTKGHDVDAGVTLFVQYATYACRLEPRGQIAAPSVLGAGARLDPRGLASHFLNTALPLPSALVSVPGVVQGGPPADDDVKPTRVLVLLNCVAPHELEDNVIYEDVLEDVREQCAKYGEVQAIAMPRYVEPDNVEPDHIALLPPGAGYIFVKFLTKEQANEARRELGGLIFDGRAVITSFYDEDKFDAGNYGEFGLPQPIGEAAPAPPPAHPTAQFGAAGNVAIPPPSRF